MSRDQAAVVVLLAAYTALMVYLAWFGKRRTRGLADYYVGGRSLGGAALGLSFFATYASTNSYLGFSGKAYAYGAPWLLMVPAAVGFSWLAWKFVAPRLRVFTEQLDSVTVPDFLGFRFESQTVRVAAALIVVFASLLYMTAVYKGIGTLVGAFLDISYVASIALVLVVVVVYTSVGGFHSVVRTDVVQGLLMVVAAVLLFSGILRRAGGLGSLGELGTELSSDGLLQWDAALPFPILLGVVVASTIKFVVEPRQLSRFYALEDAKAARVGIWVSSLTFLFVFSLLTPIGLLAHGMKDLLGDGAVDTDAIVPELLASGQLFGPYATAFLMVAMVSAAMSSLDSVLLVVASTCQRDLTGLLRKQDSDARRVSTTRVYVVLLAVVTALIALRPPGGIVELTSFSGALYGACFLPPVVLGLYWQRGNAAGALWSFAVGIGVLVGWRFSPLGAYVHQVFPAIFLSLLVFWLVGRTAPPASGQIASAFAAYGCER